MTFSIVAADPEAGDWGVAVASRFPCVGAVVPWARAGVGAVATQSWANTAFGPDGLALMHEGVPAEETLGRLVEADEGREDRQVGLVDAAGRAATFTGLDVHGLGRRRDRPRVRRSGQHPRGRGGGRRHVADVRGGRRRSVRPAAGGAARGRRGGRGPARPPVRGAPRRPGGWRLRGSQRPVHRPARGRSSRRAGGAGPPLRRLGHHDADPQRPPARGDPGADRRPPAAPRGAREAARRRLRGVRRPNASGVGGVGGRAQPRGPAPRRRPDLEPPGRGDPGRDAGAAGLPRARRPSPGARAPSRPRGRRRRRATSHRPPRPRRARGCR